jgi:Wiskott-Aldrich syndrome protein
LKKKFMSFFGKKDDDDDGELLISEPRNFRHLSSIGWNPNEGTFEIRNIPPEWRKLFQAAGIKKSELKNKDTAAFVMNIIEGATPPPPPPPASYSPSSSAPPPPPAPYAPSSYAPSSYSPSAPAPPPPPPISSGGSRSGLLSEIQKGAQLKHVDDNDANNTTPAAAPPSSGLAETLARAMAERRAAIKEDTSEEVGEDDGGEWSDD